MLRNLFRVSQSVELQATSKAGCCSLSSSTYFGIFCVHSVRFVVPFSSRSLDTADR
jgi:hypothetical protein